MKNHDNEQLKVFIEHQLDLIAAAFGVPKEALTKPAASIYKSSYTREAMIRHEFEYGYYRRSAAIGMARHFWDMFDREQNEIIGLA